MSERKIYKGDIVKDYTDYIKKVRGEKFDPTDPDNKWLIEFMKEMVAEGLVEEDE